MCVCVTYLYCILVTTQGRTSMFQWMTGRCDQTTVWLGIPCVEQTPQTWHTAPQLVCVCVFLRSRRLERFCWQMLIQGRMAQMQPSQQCWCVYGKHAFGLKTQIKVDCICLQGRECSLCSLLATGLYHSFGTEVTRSPAVHRPVDGVSAHLPTSECFWTTQNTRRNRIVKRQFYFILFLGAMLTCYMFTSMLLYHPIPNLLLLKKSLKHVL